MFKKEPTKLDDAMNDVYSEMKGFTADTDEYGIMVDQLIKLHSMRAMDKTRRIHPDTLATISANLVGIALVLHYERLHVVTSKALNLVLKLR